MCSLHNIGGIILLKSMLGAPIFKDNVCGGKFGIANKFKNSIGQCIAENVLKLFIESYLCYYRSIKLLH